MKKLEVMQTLDRCLEGYEYFREEVRRRIEENERTLQHLDAMVERVTSIVEMIAQSPVDDFAEISGASIEDCQLPKTEGTD